MSQARLTWEDDRLCLSGTLDFSSVTRLRDQGLAEFGANRDIRLDLARVSRANSAGLALLLEWLALAQARQVRLRILNLPESLAALARVSNLHAHLPLEKDLLSG